MNILNTNPLTPINGWKIEVSNYNYYNNNDYYYHGETELNS